MAKCPVLVTGGAGYIGGHAVLALIDAGWPVTVIHDLSNGTRKVIPSDVPFYEGSIADVALLQQIFDSHRVGAVMHFAGSIVVPESVENPILYYGNNTVVTSLINFRGGRVWGQTHPVLVDRCGLRAPKRVPVEETAAIEPINPYGASKLMTERILLDISAAVNQHKAVPRLSDRLSV